MYDKLQYEISSWRQLPECLSNNSKDLHIHITDFFNNDTLKGFRISVDHTTFGTLFATVVEPRGIIVDEIPEKHELYYDTYSMPTKIILQELRKFGFYITFTPKLHLGGSQLDYLSTVNHLGYDKIRHLVVRDSKIGQESHTLHIILFLTSKRPELLDNTYVMPKARYVDALMDGSISDITEISRNLNFRWDWLDHVSSIDDILRVHAPEMISEEDFSHDQ